MKMNDSGMWLLTVGLFFHYGFIHTDEMKMKGCDPASERFLPHPSNCHKFLRFVWGRYVEMSCPDGLFYDTCTSSCNYKDRVFCKGNPCNIKNGGCHQTCIYINNNSYSCACKSGYQLDRNYDKKTCIQGSINMETYCRGRHGDQLPDPRNCNTFIKCVGNNIAVTTCGELEYNEVTKTCDYKWSARCKGRDYTAWSKWSACFKPESDGDCIRKRTRKCSPGGVLCNGAKSEIQTCKKEKCPPTEVSPCALQNGGCMDICHNVGGHAICSCKIGRKLANDRKSCTSGGCGIAQLRDDKVLSFIISGQSAKIGSFPWQAAIYITDVDDDGKKERVFHCGGSLIDKRHIVTAAHCFPDFTLEEMDGVTVVLGEHDRTREEGREQELKVIDIYTHKKFNGETIRNDICILQLSEDALISDYITPICLPNKDEELKPGTSCRVTGWGNVLSSESKSDVLQEITVPVVEESECKKKNTIGGREVTKKMICTGNDFNFKSACRGDSGGPLSCMMDGVWKLFGIVSWGDPQCNALNQFNVFTKVSKYVNWIDRYRRS